MQRFFFDDEVVSNDLFSVTGDKYNHIVRVLRISAGEKVVFCDGRFTDYECELVHIGSESADFRITERRKNESKSDIRITVFQCLPKGDKMDEAVKRCVQFGAYAFVPVISSRCVSRPDEKSAKKKVERLNKISRSSAMQSMGGCIPEVSIPVNYKQALEMLLGFDTFFICYENENTVILEKNIINGKNIAFLIGPEGGISTEEAELASQMGIPCVSLGRRILRTEDAAAFAIPIILSLTNNL